MNEIQTSTALLGLLGAGPSHGYDLKQEYDKFFGTKRTLAFGQVYATLARLLKAGYIVSLGGLPGSGPDRKAYEITPAGRAQVEQWMFTPDIPSQTLQTNLFAKTVIALLLGDDAEHLLDLQRKLHLAQMRELVRTKQTGDISTILLCDHALFHIEADLRWIELTSARLNELRSQVVTS
ncbi:MAG: PadR family transcriptional regulator [Propionibacteriaceae bacterium]|jgi:DNA-binding PadR family transcriptional regulator|nr:PadR family transcriptional regulator [Propionibacteriaceae bacterium]